VSPDSLVFFVFIVIALVMAATGKGG